MEGDEVVSGLGDLIIFNSEVFLGNLFGSLLELKEFNILISADNIESSSVLGSTGGDCIVAGGIYSLWSVLNISNKEIFLFSHSTWRVDSISSSLSDVEWLLSLLDVSDSLSGGGINSVWSFLNDIDVCGCSNWNSDDWVDSWSDDEGWVDNTWSDDEGWVDNTWSDYDGTIWSSTSGGAFFPASLSGGHKESSGESFHCEL